MSDIERPTGLTNPLISLSDENIAVAEATGGNPATTPVSEASQRMPRMSPAAAEEYIASLYATVLKRDPYPEELAQWVNIAVTSPPEQIYFAFVNSKEYKLQQEKSVSTTFAPGRYYSRIVDPSHIFENSPGLSGFGKTISFGESGHSEEIIGPGWSFQEDAYRWMTGGFSVLTLPMPAESDAADNILMFRVTPYTANGQIDCQHCTIVCGSETVAEVRLQMSVPTWIGFRISAEMVVSEKLAILFVHPDAASPQKFGIGPDSRELAVAVHEAVLLPVTEADELTGWRGRTGQYVSSDWRSQALVPDWKRIASKFQSMGADCEFGLVQRQCGAEPLGLFRFSYILLHGLIQCLRSDFSELNDDEKLSLYLNSTGEYVGKYKSLDLFHHTFVRTDQNLDIGALHRKESTRLKMMARLFKEDLEDGEKVFVLLRKFAPLDEFEVLPVISLMRRYNPKAALLWITVAGPDERQLVGQCEMVGNNLLKGYIDRFSGDRVSGYGDWSTLSVECWKNILVSALQALGRPIPTHAQGLPPEQNRLTDSSLDALDDR